MDTAIPGAAELRVTVQLRPGALPVLLPTGLLPQIVSEPSIAPLPGCADWFLGVLARRGAVVPVFDVAAQWGEPPLSVPRRQVVLIESPKAIFAILSATLPDVVSVSPTAVTPPAAVDSPCPDRYVAQWRPVGERLLPVFDLLSWLADATPGVRRRRP
jgi:chemotaxis signal transduction protein